MLRITFLIFSMCALFNYDTLMAQQLDGFVKMGGGVIQASNLNLQVKPFFISKTEISNKEYRTFLLWLEKNRSSDELAEATQALDVAQTKLLPKNYLKSFKYDNYPVVGVSYRAAQLYCEYLNAIHPGLPGKFRLPDDREWLYASAISNDDMLHSEIAASKDKSYNFKLTTEKTAPMPVNSLKANGFGIYNMVGNVAEWTNSPGRIKGGSWNDNVETLNIKKPGKYNGQTAPSPFIGFRPVYFEEPVK